MCYVISVYLSEAVVHKCIKAVNDICYTEAVNDITNIQSSVIPVLKYQLVLNVYRS